MRMRWEDRVVMVLCWFPWYVLVLMKASMFCYGAAGGLALPFSHWYVELWMPAGLVVWLGHREGLAWLLYGGRWLLAGAGVMAEGAADWLASRLGDVGCISYFVLN